MTSWCHLILLFHLYNCTEAVMKYLSHLLWVHQKYTKVALGDFNKSATKTFTFYTVHSYYCYYFMVSEMLNWILQVVLLTKTCLEVQLWYRSGWKSDSVHIGQMTSSGKDICSIAQLPGGLTFFFILFFFLYYLLVVNSRARACNHHEKNIKVNESHASCAGVPCWVAMLLCCLPPLAMLCAFFANLTFLIKRYHLIVMGSLQDSDLCRVVPVCLTNYKKFLFKFLQQLTV